MKLECVKCVKYSGKIQHQKILGIIHTFHEILRKINDRNNALEQLGHKFKEEEIITESQCLQKLNFKLKVKKPLLGLPNVLNKKNSIPHILCHSVSLVLQAPQAVKMEKQDNSDKHQPRHPPRLPTPLPGRGMALAGDGRHRSGHRQCAVQVEEA